MEQVKCPICNNLQTKELFNVKYRFEINDQTFSIIKCLNCEIVFTYPVLTRKELEKFYPNNYFGEHRQRGIFEKIYFKYIFKYVLNYETKRLIKFAGKGEILDVGCTTGLRLETYKKAGFHKYYGIEPTEEGYQDTKRKNLPVERTTLEDFNCQKKFDIITLYETFEHLHEPVKHLNIIKKILNPNGWLVIQVPNSDSWQAKLFKDKWLHIDAPRHCFHYTSKTLSNLLTQNGFEVKFIDYKINFVRPLFWGFSFCEGQNKAFYWTFLMLISIIPTMIENIFGECGHITIYAINQNKQ